jgi:molecular chaperone HscB
MNYFDFYEIPLSFHPDLDKVKAQYYAFSKKYHPDFYIQQDDDKQAEVLELSTQNNKAYQVLSDSKKLLKYILELKEVIAEGESYALPQSFLMDMMDVNEAIMDLQFDSNADKLQAVSAEVQEIEKQLDSELNQLTQGFESLNEEAQAECLQQVKELFYRGNYVRRLKQSIAKLA